MIIVVVSVSFAIDGDPERLARVFAHAWQPELGPLPNNLDSLESEVVETARYARAGDFKGALASLSPIERRKTDARARYISAFLKRQLILWRTDYVSQSRPAGRTGYGVEDSRNKMELDSLWVAALTDPREKGAAHRATASSILMFTILSRSCLSDLSPYSTLGQQAKESPSLRIPSLAAQEVSSEECLKHAANFQETIEGGALASESQQLLELLVSSRVALTKQDFTSARNRLKEGLNVALNKKWAQTAALWMIALGDLESAPYGFPLTLGLDLSSEPHVRAMLEADRPSAALSPLPAQALSAATAYYNEAERHLGRSPAVIRLRRAYLAYRAGVPASELYRDAASAALKEGWPRGAIAAYASAGLLSADRTDLEAAADISDRYEYVGGHLSIIEMTHSISARLIADGDRFEALSRLRAAGPALVRRHRRSSVPLLSLWSDIEQEIGRDESMIEISESIADIHKEQAMKAQAVNELLHKEGRGAIDFAGAFNEFSAASTALTKLILALGRKYAIEGLPVWAVRQEAAKRRLSEAMTAMVRATPKELDGTFDVAAATAQVSEMLNGRLEENRVQVRLQKSIFGRTDCPGVVVQAEKALKRARQIKSTALSLRVLVLAGGCDATMRARAREELGRLQPIEKVKATLQSQMEGLSGDSDLELTRAIADMRSYTEQAQLVGHSDLVQGWMRDLRLVIPNRRRYEALIQWSKLQQAIAENATANTTAARMLLTDIVKSGDFWISRADPETRYKVRLALSETEVIDGNAEAALLESEKATAELDRWVELRNGLETRDPAAAEFAMLQRQVAVLGRASERQRKRIEELREYTARNRGSERREPSIDELRAGISTIPPKSVLLAYGRFQSGLVVWRISRSRPVEMIRLTTRTNDVLRAIASLRLSLAEGVDDWQPIAERLHRDLVLPAGAIPNGTTLAISGADALAGLAFDALRDSAGKPLISRHPIVYLRRVALTAADPGRLSMTGRAVFVGLNGLSLVNAEDDASAGAALFGTKAFLGSEATPEALLKSASDAEWVHIASHGVFNANNPYRSYLQLSGGVVNAWEVFGRLRSAQFVVLSACDTTFAQEYLTEAPGGHAMSMAAFASRAGASRVLASAWKADDKTASRAMRRFYERMSQSSQNPAEALQWAKLQTIAGGFHPFYYANLLLVVQDPAALTFQGRFGATR